jgi:hypothetical protein
MSVKTDILLWVQTFDHELYVYNTEMQFYRHMTVNHLFIIQGTGGNHDGNHDGNIRLVIEKCLNIIFI